MSTHNIARGQEDEIDKCIGAYAQIVPPASETPTVAEKRGTPTSLSGCASSPNLHYNILHAYQILLLDT